VRQRADQQIMPVIRAGGDRFFCNFNMAAALNLKNPTNFKQKLPKLKSVPKNYKHI